LLSRITIDYFQSLHHIDLELGNLTVIVGASSSGKSAFTRAVRTLTSNARGAAFITHGERICTIKAVTDNGIVTLKRGKATDDNEYTLVPADPNQQQKTYTKLGGSVPEEVSAFIGIKAKDPINYAGQHDKPYLLGDDTSGGEIARTLGALTNVSIIFEAARESNRRKLNNAGTLKTRAADIALIRAKAEHYKPLKAQLAAMEEAEKNLARAVKITDKLRILSDALDTLELSESVLSRLGTILDVEVPDASTITAAAERLALFQDTLSTITAQAAAQRAATADHVAAEALHTQLNDTYTEALIAAGTCPTCNQGTETLEHSHAS
jgi:DNA repair ATPase RecN